MKAQHRKELHTNAMADHLGRLIQKVRTGPKSTPVMIWVFLGLAVVAVGFWWYFDGSAKNQRAAQWAKLDQATEAALGIGDRQDFLDELQRIYDDGKGSVPGRAARFQRARFMLQQGLQFQFALGSGREGALRNLEEARALYRQLATESQDSPVLAQEALMGAATAEEALIGTPLPDNAEGERGTLDQAIADYQKLADTYPDSSQGKAARKRAEELRDHSQQWQDFYAELNKRSASK